MSKTESWLGFAAFSGVVLGLWAGGAFDRHGGFVSPEFGIDTTVDDSRNIQEAINAAHMDGTNIVTLEPRSYILKRPIIMGSNITLLGSGARILAESSPVFVDPDGIKDFAISNLNFYYPRPGDKALLQ